MKRKIIHIDEEKCNGCGQCIPNCPEGALQMIDGKARLISDLFCDGLGACIGECPVGAIEIEEREAEPYDERRVMANIVRQGENVVRAHLEHLREHGETEYLNEAMAVLKESGMAVEDFLEVKEEAAACGGGCPGSRAREIFKEETQEVPLGDQPSELRQWPIQMHLIPPSAPYFKDADVLLAADCVAYSVGDFHSRHLRGKRLAIACPKLDTEQDIYLDKLTALIDHSSIRSLTVMTMEVPCCTGLLRLAQQALDQSERKIPMEWIKVGVQGDILQTERLEVAAAVPQSGS